MQRSADVCRVEGRAWVPAHRAGARRAQGDDCKPYGFGSNPGTAFQNREFCRAAAVAKTLVGSRVTTLVEKRSFCEFCQQKSRRISRRRSDLPERNRFERWQPDPSQV